jgi:hypothetical protein
MNQWLNRRVLISGGIAALIIGSLIVRADLSTWKVVSWIVGIGGLYLSLTHRGGITDQSALLVLVPSLTFLAGSTLFYWDKKSWEQLDLAAIFAFIAYAVIHREPRLYAPPAPARRAVADRAAPSLPAGSESVEDGGKAFLALITERQPEGWDQAKRLVTHFQGISAQRGSKITLRSWAPTERGAHPRCLVRFTANGTRSATEPLCEIRQNGQITISAAPIKRRAPKAFAGVVKAGVHEDASQRSYPATVALVKALSAAALE